MSKHVYRQYDFVIPPHLLGQIRKTRSGDIQGAVRHPVGTQRRGERTVLKYPWDKMKPGDFFDVPIDGRNPLVLETAFRQAAARRDWEITVELIDLADFNEVRPETAKKRRLEPGYRVRFVFEGLRKYKIEARRRNPDLNLTSSDGRWRDRKNRGERRKRQQAREQAAQRGGFFNDDE